MLPVRTGDGAKNGDVLIKSALKLLYMLFGIFLLSEMQVSLTATDVRFITSCHVLSQGQQSLPPNHAVVGFLSGHCSSGGTSNVLFLSSSLVSLPFFTLSLLQGSQGFSLIWACSCQQGEAVQAASSLSHASHRPL